MAANPSSTLSESLACNHCHQGTQDSSIKTKGPSDELILLYVEETLSESLTSPYIQISLPSDTMRPTFPNSYSNTIYDLLYLFTSICGS
jgi:hypothetical protein